MLLQQCNSGEWRDGFPSLICTTTEWHTSITVEKENCGGMLLKQHNSGKWGGSILNCQISVLTNYLPRVQYHTNWDKLVSFCVHPKAELKLMSIIMMWKKKNNNKGYLQHLDFFLISCITGMKIEKCSLLFQNLSFSLLANKELFRKIRFHSNVSIKSSSLHSEVDDYEHIQQSSVVTKNYFPYKIWECFSS